MVDREKLQTLLQSLDSSVLYLQQLSQLTLPQLKADFKALRAAKYYVQIAVEACINIATHIIARLGFRSPETYADSFAVLAENGVIDQSLVKTTQQMVGMRNRLVHLYWEINANVVYDVLQNHLIDFIQFKAQVLAYLRQKR